jgi:hypothetical protein
MILCELFQQLILVVLTRSLGNSVCVFISTQKLVRATLIGHSKNIDLLQNSAIFYVFDKVTKLVVA